MAYKSVKPLAIFFISLGLIMCSYGIISTKDSGIAYFEKKFPLNVWTLNESQNIQNLNTTGNTDNSKDSIVSQQKEIINRNFQIAFAHYDSIAKNLESSLQILIVLLISGLFVLFFKNIFPDKGIDFPLLQFKIPITLIYLVIIFGIIYEWCHIGLLTNDGIDCRLSLYTLIQKLEVAGPYRLFYKYSNTNALADSGFIDNMCGYYYNIFREHISENGASVNWLSFLGIYAIYGPLFGVSMGVSFSTITEFTIREKIRNSVFIIMILFSSTFYLMACIVIFKKFPYTIAFLGSWWIYCGTFMLVWRYKNRLLASS